jgi:lysophospholipase L1-like esterase
MTGGGNDILMTGLSADCANGGTQCQMQLNAIGMGLANLWKQMATDGVQDVIHIMYSASAGGGLKDPQANMVGLSKICDAVPPPLHCHLLNTDALVTKSDLMADGIHPSAAACDRIAQAVIDMMKMQGMRR